MTKTVYVYVEDEDNVGADIEEYCAGAETADDIIAAMRKDGMRDVLTEWGVISWPRITVEVFDSEERKVTSRATWSEQVYL